MTHSPWIVKLIAAAVIPVLIGMGAAFSASSPLPANTRATVDETYRPGADGVDVAAVTGPRGPSRPGQVPACADPARRGDLRPCLR